MTTDPVERQGKIDYIARIALLAGLGTTMACYSGVESGAGAGEEDTATDTAGATAASSAGESGGTDPAGETSAEPDPDLACLNAVQPQPLRRLDPVQYRNTIRALFGDPTAEPTYADDAVVVTEVGVRQLRASAESILANRDQWTAEVFPCATDGAADDACAETFVRSFGARVFRRPITDSDVQWLLAVYESALYDEQLPFADAMDVVLATMLQAPEVLYVVEQGTPLDDAPDHIRALDDYEMASRLSYFLWDSMPDAELFAAAAAGELTTRAGLTAQVERMLESPQSEEKLQTFFSEWLQLDGGRLHFPLEETTKDATYYPEFGPQLQSAMRTEVEALVNKIFFEDGEATIDRLFLDRDAFVNGALAQLYDVPNGPSDDDTWAWVELDAEQRAGLLTRAAFLTVLSSAQSQSPIRRGVYVLEELLCADLGTPPPNANDLPPDGGDGLDPDGNPIVRSVREEVEARTGDGACNGCHANINPAGFLFEHYDALGRWQTEEVVSGRTVDASGALTIGDVAGPMQDALELSTALAQSNTVRQCFAQRWVGQAFHSLVEELDDCTREQVIDQFVATGDMRGLFVAIATADSFRNVNVSGVE